MKKLLYSLWIVLALVIFMGARAHFVPDIVVTSGRTIIDVRGSGAVLDGVTDDTDAINTAISTMVAGDTLVIPRGTVISTGITFDPPDDCNLVCYGTIQDDSAGVAFTIGDDNVNRRYKIQGLKVISSAVDQSAGRIGVLVHNLYESILDIRKVYGYNTGIEFRGTDSHGCVYNETHLGLLYDNKYSLYLTANTNGWCNENSFYGGRFSWDSTTPSYDGFRHIWLDHYATHPINSNKFYSPSLEGGKNAAGGETLHGIYCEARNNQWFGTRLEMGVLGRIEFTATSLSNVIYESYGVYSSTLDATGTTLLTDDGIYNTIWGYFASKINGTSASSLLTLENGHGDQYPGLTIIQTSTGASNVTIAGSGAAKFGEIKLDGTNAISQEGTNTSLTLNSSGTQGVAVNWAPGAGGVDVGTGGLTVYDGTLAHDIYFTAQDFGAKVFDGAGNIVCWIQADGDIYMNDAGTAKIFFDATHYLYLNGNDLFWFNGTIGAAVN